MPVTTAVDFKKEVKRLFETFDRQDVTALKSLMAEDIQGVDEISRRWLRGKASIDEYFEMLRDAGVADIRSRPAGLTVKQWDDVAVVTCMVNQSYKANGKAVDIEVPTTVLYRLVNDDWKIQLIHGVALPDQA